MQVSESSGGVLRQSSEEVQKVNKREDHSDLWPPARVWAKMIKDFVIEYAKMEAHSAANITAEKYENQDFKSHQLTNHEHMETWNPHNRVGLCEGISYNFRTNY